MRTRGALGVLAAAVLAVPVAGAAQNDAVPWTVVGQLLGKPHKHKDGYKTSEDVSGIACAAADGFPRSCLLIDDSTQFAQAVTLDDGEIEAGAAITLIDDTFGNKRLEFDGEGVGFADGIFYVIGSHGGPRRLEETADRQHDEKLITARVRASSRIARVRIAGENTLFLLSPLSLTAAIASQPELAAASRRRLDENGLTIEGVAVKDGRLIAGFRGPLLSGRATALSVSLQGLSGQGPLDPHLFKLSLGAGRGIRDMAPAANGILLLAGPSADTPGPASIAFWNGRSETAEELVDLQKDAGIAPSRKAEALLVLDETPKTMRVLVMFDGERQGAPLALTVHKP